MQVPYRPDRPVTSSALLTSQTREQSKERRHWNRVWARQAKKIAECEPPPDPPRFIPPPMPHLKNTHCPGSIALTFFTFTTSRR